MARYVVAPGEVRLGAYAFNDAITAALRDPDTGVTYVGGDFTELGLRTGPVAEVEPPGAGTGARIDGSPDVVGRITAATPDDDGYLLFGDLVAVNGAAVPLINGSATSIVRIGADNELDTGWNVTAKSLACANYGGETQADLADLETMGNYVIVPFPRIRVDTSLNRTSTGLGLLDRASGVIYLTGQGTGLAPDGSACSRLWASIPPLPQVSGCTAQQCFADITTVTRDTTTGVLLVTYAFHRQLSGGGASHSLVLAGYNTLNGTRLWAREILGPDPANAPGWATSSAPLPGAFLLTGAFPIETAPLTWDHTTNTMLIDALTGATRQRWTVLGEVSLADPLGDPIAPATLCLPAYTNGVAGQASVSPSQLASLGRATDSDDTTTTHVVCTYGLDGGGHVVDDPGRPGDAPALERHVARAGRCGRGHSATRSTSSGRTWPSTSTPASRSSGPPIPRTGPRRDGDAPGRQPAGPRRAVPVPARDAGAAPRGPGRDPGAARGVRRVARHARRPVRDRHGARPVVGAARGRGPVPGPERRGP